MNKSSDQIASLVVQIARLSSTSVIRQFTECERIATARGLEIIPNIEKDTFDICDKGKVVFQCNTVKGIVDYFERSL